MKSLVLFFGILLVMGCSSNHDNIPAANTDYPVFTLAWSEYPSWSVFGVAQDKGLISGKRSGPLGSLEKKWKVRIELKLVDYDTCMTMYGSNSCDATCLTNMDALNPSLGRPSTAIMPTSTSAGADACLVVGIDSLDALQQVVVYGLEKSVSEYAFVRCLEKKGVDPAKYKFSNMDPGAAAQAMQTGQKNVRAIMVWNPFVLQTLRTRPDVKRIFDSSLIPGEIVDMVVVANDAMGKVGGEAFAYCLCDAYYEVNRMLADLAKGDETYIALGSKFSSLGVQDMRQCCQETKFYDTPYAGAAIFDGADFRIKNQKVAKFCVKRGIVPRMPDLGYGDRSKRLNFDSFYMKTVKSAN